MNEFFLDGFVQKETPRDMPKDCVEKFHDQVRMACDRKFGADYEACVISTGLRRESSDPQNEVVCKVDGFSRPFYLNYENGRGQVQRVHGMPMRGAPTKVYGTSEKE